MADPRVRQLCVGDLARPAKDLPIRVLKGLSLYLHQVLNNSGNWETVAEDLGYNYDQIKDFINIANVQRVYMPAEIMLRDWRERGSGRSLFVLKEALLKSDRLDCVEYLEKEIYDRLICVDLNVGVVDTSGQVLRLQTVKTRYDATLQDSLENTLGGSVESYRILDSAQWTTLARDYKGKQLNLMCVKTVMPDSVVMDPTVDSSCGYIGEALSLAGKKNNLNADNREGVDCSPIRRQCDNCHTGSHDQLSLQQPPADIGGSVRNIHEVVSSSNSGRCLETFVKPVMFDVTMSNSSSSTETSESDKEWCPFAPPSKANIPIETKPRSRSLDDQFPLQTVLQKKKRLVSNTPSFSLQEAIQYSGKYSTSGTAQGHFLTSPSLSHIPALEEVTFTETSEDTMKRNSELFSFANDIELEESNVNDQCLHLVSVGDYEHNWFKRRWEEYTRNLVHTESFEDEISENKDGEAETAAPPEPPSSRDQLSCGAGSSVSSPRKPCGTFAYEKLHHSLSCPADTSNIYLSLQNQSSVTLPTIADMFSPPYLQLVSDSSSSLATDVPSSLLDPASIVNTSNNEPDILSDVHRPPQAHLSAAKSSCPLNELEAKIVRPECEPPGLEADLSPSSLTYRPLPCQPRFSSPPQLPPRTTAKFMSHPYKVLMSKSSKTLLDSYLANDTLFTHYNKELKSFPGWCPRETELTVERTMRNIMNEDGYYLIWYSRSRKCLVLSVSHVRKIIHYRVHTKPAELQGKLFYYIFPETATDNIKMLFKYHEEEGLRPQTDQKQKQDNSEFLANQNAHDSRRFARYSHIWLKWPIQVDYGPRLAISV